MFQIIIKAHQCIYKFTCLDFGIKVALAIFLRVIDTTFWELDFAVAYLDDILPKSENPKENKCFRGLQGLGLWIPAVRIKTANFINEIKYLGRIIDENAKRPDPARFNAIKEMPAPNKISWVWQIITTYLCQTSIVCELR